MTFAEHKDVEEGRLQGGTQTLLGSRMAHRRMMGHTGWLVVFVFIYGFRSGLCDISLTMEKTVTGYRKDSVVIPCTYATSNNEDVIKVEWEFNNNPVIYRDDKQQDHIPLLKYRERATISKTPSGDVSLTLRELHMEDRGNFKCKVTGRGRNGKIITHEDVTILKVLRKKTETADANSGENDFWTTKPPTEQPQVTTAEDEVTTKILITTKPDVRVSTAGEETFTEDNVSSSDEPEEIITTKVPHVVTEAFIATKPDVRVSTAEEETSTEDNVSISDEHGEIITTKIPHIVTANIVTDAPYMETEQTTRQDVKTRTFITAIPDVKDSSVAKEPDLTTDIEFIVIESTDMETETTAWRNPNTNIELIVIETTDMETETTAWRNPNTKILSTIKPSVKVRNYGGEADRTTGASSEDDSAIARTKQPRKFHSSSFPAYPFTTHVMHNDPPAEAIKTGSRIFFYILLIGILCIVSVLIVTLVLFVRRRKRKSFNYNLPTMNQLALNLEGRSCEPASNNYEPDFPVSQYESLPMPYNEYEQLVLKNQEGNDSQCQSSQ